MTIPDGYWWSGSISSKRGTNLNRKDLQEILECCKKDKKIGFLIVDEPDRFMRSIDEAAYYEVQFRQFGVQVWYASDPELNKGDLSAKLLKFTKYLSAEGSNEERQRKSIAGQTKALQEGRFPFVPKPGYRRGYERAVHEIHPVRGPALKMVLVRLASGLVSPSEALIELNKSDFMNGRSHYKMDKFRKIVTDPFYVGIVEINKQVSVRNENGLHEPLISKEQHLSLVRIMDGKPKNQGGPRKNGNPKYPCNNIVGCDACREKKNGRVVGFDHTNGQSVKIYERYRCRGCGKYLTRQELHEQVEEKFKELQLTPEGMTDLLEALRVVWKQQEDDVAQEVLRINHRIKTLRNSIADQVEAATDLDNAFIKEDILAAIARKKTDLAELESELEALSSRAENDKEQFLRFAFNFVADMGGKFLGLSPHNRLLCKQLVFPAGFYLDKNKKVYTPEISPLYRLVTNKKDLSRSEKSLLVREVDYRWNHIYDSLMLMYEKLARFGIVNIDGRLVLDSGQERDNEL